MAKTPENTISSVNRRRESRFTANGQIRYLPTRAAKQWRYETARVLDYSAHGLGIECDTPLTVGEDFIVKLRIEKVRLVVYRVRSVVFLEGRYRVGAEFIGMLVGPDDVDTDTILHTLHKHLGNP